MKLPSTTLPPLLVNETVLTNRLIVKARTRLFPALIVSALLKMLGQDPLSSMTGVPAKPGCVVPSIVTGSVIVGSVLMRLIVNGPAPGMLKEIKSAPGVSLASRMANCKEPGPVAFVLVTTKVLFGSILAMTGAVCPFVSKVTL